MEQHFTMKKLALAVALWLLPVTAFAQCTGVFPPQTLCGNLSGSPAPPSAFTASGTIVGPGSSTNNGLAIWANTAGTQLKDANGLTIAGNYTWGGTQTYSGTNTFNATVNFTSTFQIAGNPMTFPVAAATLVSAGNGNTWAGAQAGTFNVTGTFQIGGVTVALPISTTNGGTGVSAPAAHTVGINEGASPQAAVGPGSIGQALISGGASADPSYKDGTWVLLNTVTANNTSTTVTDTTSISANYTRYKIVLDQLLPATNNITATLQVQVSGTFQSTTYLASANNGNGSAIASISGTTGVLIGNVTSVPNTGPGVSATYYLNNPGITLTCKLIKGDYAYLSPTVVILGTSAGCYNGGSAAITGAQVNSSSGNWVSGTMKIYGASN